MSTTTEGTATKQKSSKNNKTLKLHYSYNPKITPNMSKQQAAQQSWGWQLHSVEWDLEALTNMVKEECYLPSEVTDGHKIKANVEKVYFLPLDFDKGTPTVDEFIKEASNWEFSWFLHTTVSHRKESESPIDRFRVIIPFSKFISNDEMRRLKSYWVEKFPQLDTSCFQGERYYYRSPKAETHIHSYKDGDGNIVWLNPHIGLDELKSKDTAPVQPNSPKSKKRNNKNMNGGKEQNSEEEFDLDIGLKLANASYIKVKDVEVNTHIFCPFCDPQKRNNPNEANAFINKNSSGSYLIYCFSEDKIYWQKSADRSGIFISKNNNYRKMLKRGKEWVESKISSFIIQPKELLVLEGNDTLKCDTLTDQGYKYEDILIDNKDWHSKTKLLTAIGHQDCTFTGSDNDVQLICELVNQNVLRKTGTKTIGLHDKTWVVDNQNISSSGIAKEQSIVPSEKGADAFCRKIEYPIIGDQESKQLITGFYDNIFSINKPETIIPFVCWSFISPLKPKLTKIFGGFPQLFVHGGQGSGKTSTAIMHMRLYGYNTETPFSCTMRLFPMLKLLSSSNAIPVVFDEFKKSDMTDYEVNNMTRYMRRSYSGETETKGRADQSTVDYRLTAPMIVMGEWNILQPAIRERIIAASFTNAVKGDENMQDAFERLNRLPLESFMSKYIPYVLQQDITSLVKIAEDKIKKQFKSINVVPRIKKNLTMMYMGFLLFRGFAQANNITQFDDLNIDAVLTNQLEEITGNTTGEVESAVDQLFTGLSTMLSSTHYFGLSNGKHFRILNDDNLAIRFNAILPIFKKWARETQYECDFLDPKSYLKLFNDTDYISKDKNVRYGDEGQKKSIYINVEKAFKAGVDLEGFGVEDKSVIDIVSSLL